jgi:hypothetical protein
VTFRTYAITSTCGDDVIAYCGGGDILPGVPFSVGRNATLEERILNLKNFYRQTRIQIGTETASTNDIIKYVANALGAAHFDPSGKAAHKYDLLQRIESGEVGQLPLLVNDRNPLYHEILSIAQAVVRSPQVAELLGWSAPKSKSPAWSWLDPGRSGCGKNAPKPTFASSGGSRDICAAGRAPPPKGPSAPLRDWR